MRNSAAMEKLKRGIPDYLGIGSNFFRYDAAAAAFFPGGRGNRGAAGECAESAVRGFFMGRQGCWAVR